MKMRRFILFVGIYFYCCSKAAGLTITEFKVLKGHLQILFSPTIWGAPEKRVAGEANTIKDVVNNFLHMFDILEEAAEPIEVKVKHAIRKIEHDKLMNITTEGKLFACRNVLALIGDVLYGIMILADEMPIFDKILPGLKTLYGARKFIMDFLILKGIYALEKKTGYDLKVVVEAYRKIFSSDPKNRRKWRSNKEVKKKKTGRGE